MVGLGFLRGSWRLQYSTREKPTPTFTLISPYFHNHTPLLDTSKKVRRRTSKETSWRTSRS